MRSADPVRQAEHLLRQSIDNQLQPVPIITLCHAQNITVYAPSFTSHDIAVALMGRHGMYTIFVDKTASAVYQRFLIAHALAHYFLHCAAYPDRANQSLVESYDGLWPIHSGDSHERHDDQISCEECRTHRLANALLMPRTLIIQGLSYPISVSSLAFLLGVSRPMLRQRLREIAR